MSFTLALVGDLMFSHRVRERLKLVEDPAWPLRPVEGLLSASDLRIGNLETPVSLERRVVPGARADYFAPPEAVRALAAVGFHLVTLGNNHILDFGEEGARRTIEELDMARVAWCGLVGPAIGDRVAASLRAPDRSELAVLSYCGMRNVAVPGRAFRTIAPEPERVRRDVGTALQAGRTVIVAIHEGGSAVPSPELERTARFAVQQGATIVVVHHSHLVSGVERVGDALIAWGLGNFLAATNNFADERREGMILRCTVESGRVVDFEVLPTWVTEEPRVIPAPPEVEQRIRTRIADLSSAIASGQARTLYEQSLTPEVVSRRLREAIREMLRGGGRNILPALRSLRLRHLRFLWLGVRAALRRALGTSR